MGVKDTIYKWMIRDKVTTVTDTNPDKKFAESIGQYVSYKGSFNWDTELSPIYKLLKERKVLRRYSTLTAIPFDVVFGYMNTFFSSQYLQYREITRNKAFRPIAAWFFKYLFWNNTVWVTYNKEKDLFELWEIVGGKNLADVMLSDKPIFEFMNVLSSRKQKFNVKTEIIPVLWTGDWDRDVFIQCYVLLYEYLRDRHLILENFQIAAKSTLMTVDTTKNFKRENINRYFDGSSVIVGIGDGADGIPTKIDVITFSEWKQARECHNNTFLSELSSFGGGITEDRDKSSRLSEGENFKDLKKFFDSTIVVLDQLNDFAETVYEIWGQELEFDLTSRPNTSGVEIPKNQEPTSSDSQVPEEDDKE